MKDFKAINIIVKNEVLQKHFNINVDVMEPGENIVNGFVTKKQCDCLGATSKIIFKCCIVKPKNNNEYCLWSYYDRFDLTGNGAIKYEDDVVDFIRLTLYNNYVCIRNLKEACIHSNAICKESSINVVCGIDGEFNAYTTKAFVRDLPEEPIEVKNLNSFCLSSDFVTFDVDYLEYNNESFIYKYGDSLYKLIFETRNCSNHKYIMLDKNSDDRAYGYMHDIEKLDTVDTFNINDGIYTYINNSVYKMVYNSINVEYYHRTTNGEIYGFTQVLNNIVELNKDNVIKSVVIGRKSQNSTVKEYYSLTVDSKEYIAEREQDGLYSLSKNDKYYFCNNTLYKIICEKENFAIELGYLNKPSFKDITRSYKNDCISKDINYIKEKLEDSSYSIECFDDTLRTNNLFKEGQMVTLTKELNENSSLCGVPAIVSGVCKNPFFVEITYHGYFKQEVSIKWLKEYKKDAIIESV